MADLIKTNFELPKWDAKSISGKFIMLLMLGGLGLFIYSKILPFLINMVWGTVELAIGAVVAGFLLMILTNPKFWRGLKYLSEAIAQFTLGMAIEMNPFAILLYRVEVAEKDREELGRQVEKLKAQEADLQLQILDNEEIVKQSSAEIKIARQKLAVEPDNLDYQLALETSVTNFNNAKDFIDNVKPITNDIHNLVNYAEKAYRKSGNALLNAKNTIKKQRALYEAVTTGSNAMKKAMRAFAGDTDLNNDADLALEKLRKDISGKIGGIKNAIQVTSQFMNQQDLRDAAKVERANDAIKQLDVDKTFSYSDSITTGIPTLHAIPAKSKYNDFLSK